MRRCSASATGITAPLRDSVQNPQAVVTPTNIPYQINWRGLCSRRNPRYTPTLLAVPPPKGLSLRSGEAYTWEGEEAPTCITFNQSLPPIHDTTKRGYWVPFIPHGTRRLTVPYPAQKEAYSIRSRESQLPPGRVLTLRHVIKMLHHSQVLHLPLAPDKCVNKQIPSLTDVEHNGYGNKKVKRI